MDKQKHVTQKSETIIDRIHENYESLRNAEKIVADYLLKHSHTRLESSITDFSRKIGVSEATISRFSKAIGFDGYPDLKLAIAAGSYVTSPLPNMPTEILDTDSIYDASEKLAAVLSLSIQETQKIMNTQAMEKAVEELTSAERIVFFGVGGAAAICIEAVHMFTKAGRKADAIIDGYNQVITASALQKGDVVIGISHTGQTKSVANALSVSQKNGFPTIAMTSDNQSPVAKAAEISIVTWKTDVLEVPLFGDFLEGRICQLFLVDLLYMMVIFSNKNNEKDNLLKTGEALKQYYETK